MRKKALTPDRNATGRLLVGNLGRPLAVRTPDEMASLIQGYLDRCAESGEPLTLTGMIRSIGLSGRQAFDNYGRRSEFEEVVRAAKLLIESDYERQLRTCTGNPAAAIFALKNFGWSDRTDLVANVEVDVGWGALIDSLRRARRAEREDVAAIDSRHEQ